MFNQPTHPFISITEKEANTDNMSIIQLLDIYLADGYSIKESYKHPIFGEIYRLYIPL